MEKRDFGMTKIFLGKGFNRIAYVTAVIVIFFFVITFYSQSLASSASESAGQSNNLNQVSQKLLDPSTQQQQHHSLFSAGDPDLPKFLSNIQARIEKFFYDAESVKTEKVENEARKKRREYYQNKEPLPDFYDGLYANFKTVPHFIQSDLSARGLTGKLYNISIVTQTTVDRLYKVKMMAEKWKAPISISVFVKDNNQEKTLETLKDYVQSTPVLQEFADFHLFYANNTRYPVNNLRNLAVTNAQTDYVFIMDADFLPPIGLSEYINSYLGKNYKAIEQGDFPLNPPTNHTLNPEITESDKRPVAFVIPSFSSSLSPKLLPDDKIKLIELVYYQLVMPSNLDLCWNCHSPTNFGKWFSEDEPYEIRYRWLYEPYLVFNKSDSSYVKFDERLKGYGFDKNAHGFVLATRGYRFVVLPHAFIIHVNHPDATWEGPKLVEQQWNSLKIACDIVKETKSENQLDLYAAYFNEPIPEECFSDLHW